MLMWLVILGITIAATCIGLFYLGGRAAKFSVVGKLSGKNARRRKIAGFATVCLLFLFLSLTLNLMNAVVCLMHFVFFWLVSDFLFSLVERFRRRPFRYYYAGMTAICLSIIALAFGWYLDHHVGATFYQLKTEKNTGNLRIVQFADSHLGTTFGSKKFAELVEAMQRQNPDMVLITGDFVDDGTAKEEMIDACNALGRLRTKYGVYFAFGNHDKGYYDPSIRGFTGEDLTAELEKNNVMVLQDDVLPVGDNFYIAGRKDVSELQRGGMRKEMDALLKGLDRNKFIIVLDHQPNDYENQAAAEADLVLSGHTHGGQLWPLNRVGEWIGANDRTYGHERRRLTDFIVTSGLSDWAIKFKTGTKSEFVIIDITGGAETD